MVDYTLEKHSEEESVNVLVAFPFLKKFEKVRQKFNINEWCLDSGAFSAWQSGKTIELQEYIETCHTVDACEIFGLDVIGDPKATRLNLEKMWEEDIQAIPTFHYGSNWKQLKWAVEHSDKIALGGMARVRDSQRIPWIEQCFARAWPKKIHGFGLSSVKALGCAPFHSVDSTSWEFGPLARGRWSEFGNLKARGIKDLWVEVQEYKRREEFAKFRWRKELQRLEEVR